MNKNMERVRLGRKSPSYNQVSPLVIIIDSTCN